MLSTTNITSITSDGKVSADEISNLYKLRASEGSALLGVSGNRLNVDAFFNQTWSDNVVTANATKFSYTSKLNKSSVTSTASVTESPTKTIEGFPTKWTDSLSVNSSLDSGKSLKIALGASLNASDGPNAKIIRNFNFSYVDSNNTVIKDDDIKISKIEARVLNTKATASLIKEQASADESSNLSYSYNQNLISMSYVSAEKSLFTLDYYVIASIDNPDKSYKATQSTTNAGKYSFQDAESLVNIKFNFNLKENLSQTSGSPSDFANIFDVNPIIKLNEFYFSTVKLEIKAQSVDFVAPNADFWKNLNLGYSNEVITKNTITDTVVNNLLSYAMEASNTIKLKSKSGESASIDAGAGNDIVTGGDGNDTISGGTGKDKLSGGKGDDTFKISKSDFDFTSAKTVLADTIADFKYTSTEKDSVSLDGFGSIVVFQTVALAKKAGSTSNVIYESKTGNFWYNEDGDSALAGALLFANAKGIPDTYWVAAGVM
jgi:Ca2+-binding RTX toxin-like protein